MAKLIALYKQPGDKKKFDDHYFGTHTPLVKEIPGLRRTEVTKIVGAPAGESPFYLMCEMYFENEETMNRAMKSKEMKACSKDLGTFAGELVTMMIGETAK
ncbi:MAG TPA: EthD family reductase [Bacillales bacterium]|nr:EthD family reductase [Bacillales bacterium]